MLTLYLRKEPTDDWATKLHIPKSRLKRLRDTVIYRDAEATKKAGRIPWYSRKRYNRTRKSIVFNCCRWNVVWLPDLK